MIELVNWTPRTNSERTAFHFFSKWTVVREDTVRSGRLKGTICLLIAPVINNEIFHEDARWIAKEQAHV